MKTEAEIRVRMGSLMMRRDELLDDNSDSGATDGFALRNRTELLEIMRAIYELRVVLGEA